MRSIKSHGCLCILYTTAAKLYHVLRSVYITTNNGAASKQWWQPLISFKLHHYGLANYKACYGDNPCLISFKLHHYGLANYKACYGDNPCLISFKLHHYGLANYKACYDDNPCLISFKLHHYGLANYKACYANIRIFWEQNVCLFCLDG